MNQIFDDIIPITEKQWKNKVQVELNGLDYNKTLVWGTNNHINVKPLYTKNDVDYTYLESIFCGKTKFIYKYNEQLKDDSSTAYFFDKGNITDLDTTSFRGDLYFQYHQELDLSHLKKLTNRKFLDFDIYGYYAQNGLRLNENKKADRGLVKHILSQHHFEKCLSIQANVYQNAGANHIQEIAISLAHAVEYIEEFGIDVVDKIYFKFAIGSNYFFEIAKLRAFRFLWRLILNQYNVRNEAHIVSLSSNRNKSVLDQNNNIIRSSLEISAAILGNSNAIFVENNIKPFEQKDYISGSYYVENLVDQMSEKALELFKTIQNSGGFIKSIENETIQDLIYATAKKEQKDFDERILKLIGVNKNRTLYKQSDKIKNEKIIKQVLFLPIVPTRLAEKEEKI